MKEKKQQTGTTFLDGRCLTLFVTIIAWSAGCTLFDRLQSSLVVVCPTWAFEFVRVLSTVGTEHAFRTARRVIMSHRAVLVFAIITCRTNLN